MCGGFAQYAPMDIAPADAEALRDLDPGLDLAGILNQRKPRDSLSSTWQRGVACPALHLPHAIDPSPA